MMKGCLTHWLVTKELFECSPCDNQNSTNLFVSHTVFQLSHS